MAGIDDHVAVIGDWMPPNPIPRTFFSSNLVDDFNPKSFSAILGDDEREDPLMGPSQKLKVATDLEEGTENSVSDQHLSDLSLFSSQKSSCLAERVAARAGFNAPKLNTTRIGPATLSSSEVRSPYLMLSPGLSPTVLLDSPVFLSNSMAQPSPTTGKFVTSCSNLRSLVTQERDKDDLFEDVDNLSFAFKPHVESSSSFVQSATNKANPAINPKQSTSSIHIASDNAEIQGQNRKGFHFFEDFPISSVERDNDASLEHTEFDNVIARAENSAPLDDQQDEEGEDQRSTGELNSTIVNGAPSEDRYNWRKYGQKQVKGSECPRSYYKCTHPNCQVKKKVERSQEGHIIEIIYKGAHNHPKPPPNRRFTAGSSNLQSDFQLDTPEHLEHTGAQALADVDMAWENSQRGAATGAPDWAYDNHETTSPVSDGPESCDPSTSMLPQKGPHSEVAASSLDVPLTLSNDDDDDMGPHGSASLVCDGEEDESESKRRKIDAVEMSGASRAIREPRVVVQTTSEVDILDDGYRWRKYGQKVVKGNPNPRSYYKCTNAGCMVRKHVERASHDLKSVITTYEGKHNHDVPAARNSSQGSSGPSTMVQSSASQCRVQRPDPSHVQDSVGRLDGPVLLGKLSLHGRQQVGHSPGFSFLMNQPGLANLTMASLGPNAGQPQSRLLTLPINPYLGQQHQVNEVGFMALKEEPKSETGLNLSNRPPVYGQMMNRLPL